MSALGQKRVQASDRFVAKRIEEIAAIWLNSNGNYRHIADAAIGDLPYPKRPLESAYGRSAMPGTFRQSGDLRSTTSSQLVNGF